MGGDRSGAVAIEQRSDDARLCAMGIMFTDEQPHSTLSGIDFPDASRYGGLPQQQTQGGGFCSRPDVVLSMQHQARTASGTPLRPTEVGLRFVEVDDDRRLDRASPTRETGASRHSERAVQYR